MFGSVDYYRLSCRWKTAALFGVATALSLVAIVLRYTEINFSELSHPALVELSLLGAAAAAGGFSLLVGMWFFWLNAMVRQGGSAVSGSSFFFSDSSTELCCIISSSISPKSIRI